MPLIKPRTRRFKIVSVTCRLEASERDTLADYATFIAESRRRATNATVPACSITAAPVSPTR